jgi:hypothetical protein
MHDATAPCTTTWNLERGGPQSPFATSSNPHCITLARAGSIIGNVCLGVVPIGITLQPRSLWDCPAPTSPYSFNQRRVAPPRVLRFHPPFPLWLVLSCPILLPLLDPLSVHLSIPSRPRRIILHRSSDHHSRSLTARNNHSPGWYTRPHRRFADASNDCAVVGETAQPIVSAAVMAQEFAGETVRAANPVGRKLPATIGMGDTVRTGDGSRMFVHGRRDEGSSGVRE